MKYLLALFTGLLLILPAPPPAAAASAEKPNIIFLLVDDLGWGDLGCYGNLDIATPNLDRMANEGMLFEQFYVNGSMCSPSRAAMITGRFPAEVGIHYWMSPGHNERIGMPQALDPALPNLPRTMQRAGYRTAHFGKWHVGQDKEAPVAAYGYDETNIVWQGEGPNPGVRINSPEGTSRLVDRSIAFGEQCEAEGRPFFLTCWTFDVHAPLDPTEESLAKYDHFRSGRTRSTAMQIYYAAVTALDAQIGRLLDWVDADPARAANTLVIFTSDNGPEAAEIPHAGYHAAGSTGPFRGRKRSLYEGGVRLPFIARWKDHIPAGTVDSTSVVSGVDLLPTLARLAGADVPADAGLDGEDVSDILLSGESRKRSKPLLWEWRFEGVGPLLDRSPMLAIREGDWKLLFNPDGSRTELYDIPRQPMELHSQAERHPEVVARLRKTALAWQETLPDGPRTLNPGSLDYPGYHEAPGRGPILDRAKYEKLLQPVRIRLMRDETNGKASTAPADPSDSSPAAAPTDAVIFAKSNLAAWCIVPFDGKKRGPEERAAMLKKLGIKKFVYDYRAEHIPQWDDELAALKKNGIELLGWWFPGVMNEQAKQALELFQRHGVKPQLWVSGNGGPVEVKDEADQEDRIAREVERLTPICEAAAAHGLQVGLYNHGGWFGEPENAVAIVKALEAQGIENVGIVYNLHHGHGHLDRLPAAIELMKPHLLCFNLNGMDIEGDQKGRKILPLGVGTEDVRVLRILRESGYDGPIGILNHTQEDAEGRLLDNLDGLRWILPQLDGNKPGSKPDYRTWSEEENRPAPKQAAAGRPPVRDAVGVPSMSPAFGKALSGGLSLPGDPEYHTLPFTIECRAKLESKDRFNILVACNPKATDTHWELYTHAKRGTLALYLPGRGGDYDSGVDICDGEWHDLLASVDETKVRLWIDGKLVLEKPVGKLPEIVRHAEVESFAIGRLVEGTIGCDGIVDDVRLSRGILGPDGGDSPREAVENTLGLWDFDDLPAAAPPQAAAPEPAPFAPERPPLDPSQHIHWQEFVNRERVFDFYGKQALHFLKQKPLPELLPAFPGLDGGQQGHWGNQNDQVTWRDGRWAASDLGSLFSGVFKSGPRKGGQIVIPKGICVRFDDRAAVFDPTTLSFPVVWKGGFIQLDDRRRGFNAGAPLQGEIVAVSDEKREGRYLGLYRHGSEVIFAYEVDGGTRFLNARGDSEETLVPLTRGGPAQWPQWLETRGELGNQQPFATDRLTIPFDNPYGTVFYLSAHDFFEDGSAAVATMTGEVWLVRGIDERLETLRWKRFATGLHQPLGMKIVGGKIHVLGRDQITRLHDLNGDDEADYYECVSNAMESSRGGHDFLVGLERDAEGRWYFASGNQGLCRIGADHRVEVLATGLRNPNGLALSPDGRFLTTSGQEGNWTPASSVFQVELGNNEGAHFGATGPKEGQAPEPPLLYLPRGEDNSSSSQVFLSGDAWKPLAGDGNLVHLSSGGASAWLVMREQVRGRWQAAAVRITGNFDSGPQCARFHPGDGQLYVTGMLGWGNYAPKEGCFQRVRFTGGTPVPVGFETRENGILVRFDEPVPQSAASPGETFAQCWNYRYSAAYGSPEFSLRYPDTPGHDPLEVRSVHRLEGGKALFAEIPQLVPAGQVHLRLATGQDLFLTLHELGEPFTAFPGYTRIEKTEPTAPVAAPVPSASKPNPWAEGKAGREIRIEAEAGLQYVQKELQAKAGEHISLTFVNPDVVPHNWILAKPGSLQKVGELSNLMITDPEGLARHYVPESDDVFVWTDMINPKEQFTIHFDAPDEPGDYSYLCTFPGHWMIMNGVMKVE